MKRYKPLLSSAPEHSILNAASFDYSSSVDTDIRRTFTRILKERAEATITKFADHGRAACEPRERPAAARVFPLFAR